MDPLTFLPLFYYMEVEFEKWTIPAICQFIRFHSQLQKWEKEYKGEQSRLQQNSVVFQHIHFHPSKQLKLDNKVLYLTFQE